MIRSSHSLPPVLQRAGGVLGDAASLMLAAIVLLTCIDVVGRYVFNRPLAGALELTELAMGGLVFLSLPVVTLRREHVTVDLLAHLVPRRWRHVHEAALLALVSACLAFVGWHLWRKAIDMQAAGETTATLAIPVHPLVYAMSMLAIATAAVTLAVAWHDLRHGAPLEETR